MQEICVFGRIGAIGYAEGEAGKRELQEGAVGLIRHDTTQTTHPTTMNDTMSNESNDTMMSDTIGTDSTEENAFVDEPLVQEEFEQGELEQGELVKEERLVEERILVEERLVDEERNPNEEERAQGLPTPPTPAYSETFSLWRESGVQGIQRDRSGKEPRERGSEPVVPDSPPPAGRSARSLNDVLASGKYATWPYLPESGHPESGLPESVGTEAPEGGGGTREGGGGTREGGGGTWSPNRSLQRLTCEAQTRDALLEGLPAREDDVIQDDVIQDDVIQDDVIQDDVIARYVIYALWTTWRDADTGHRIISREVCDWMGHHRYNTGREVLSYIQDRLPQFRWEPPIPRRRCRLILDDGLPEELHAIVQADLQTPPAEYENRVYLLTGKSYNPDTAAEDRVCIKEELSGLRSKAPSEGARQTAQLLNDRPSHIFARTRKHLPDAYRYVRQMDIQPTLSRQEQQLLSPAQEAPAQEALRPKQAANLRAYYFQVLRSISDQHQPFYAFSRGGRTDRLFPYNYSALHLPRPVREILFQGFCEIDLRSAHLMIAAWLWEASAALEQLGGDTSIWDDLMAHYRPLFEERGREASRKGPETRKGLKTHKVPRKGEPLYDEVKSAFKTAVYSTVYGMPAPSVKANLTTSLRAVLGPDAGRHFAAHPVMKELFAKRDEKLRAMNVGDTLVGPTGIEVTIDQPLNGSGDGVDARSAMATLAQSYEQAVMQVILEYEKERDERAAQNHFRVALWIHDGAYVTFRGAGRARIKELNQRLQKRRKELAEFAGKDAPLPAFFETKTVEPPAMPDSEALRARPETTSSETRPSAEGPVFAEAA